jgi:hypothetical protein
LGKIFLAQSELSYRIGEAKVVEVLVLEPRLKMVSVCLRRGSRPIGTEMGVFLGCGKITF